jgi:hypothetical protein
MGETLRKDGLAMPQAFFGSTQFPLDVRHIQTTKVLELDALEQVPDAFLWIKVWGISRQLFEMNTSSSPFAQIVFDGRTSMNRRSIPDHQQVPSNLTGKQLQKANHVGSFVRMVAALCIKILPSGVMPPMAER